LKNKLGLSEKMSLSLAKKSLAFIETLDAKSNKVNKSKNQKKKKKEELSSETRTENMVKTLLSYNNTKFDEKAAKKVNERANLNSNWSLEFYNMFLLIDFETHHEEEDCKI
jgi:hypothetical protein